MGCYIPASNTYRELVSCSHTTDYQSRKLEIRFGQKKVVFELTENTITIFKQKNYTDIT